MEYIGIVLILGFALALSAYNPGNFGESMAKLGIFGVSMVQILPSLNAMGRNWMVTMATTLSPICG